MADATSNNGNLPVVIGPGAGGVIPYTVATASTIYNNVMVCTNAAGYLVNASDTSGQVFAGFSNVASVNGTVGDTTLALPPQVPVIPPEGVVPIQLNCTGAVQSWVGTLAYAIDNLTVGNSGQVSNNVVVGRIAAVLSSTTIIVDCAIRA